MRLLVNILNDVFKFLSVSAKNAILIFTDFIDCKSLSSPFRQVVPELTVWKKETQKFALKKLVDVGLLDYSPCYEERGYMKAKDRETIKP